MSSIFSKIINREIPSYIIAENENFLAFLDIFPLTKGHTLVIPKLEIDYYFDIQDELFNEINIFSKKVAIGIEKAIPCKRIGVSVVGLEVPHAHIHLIPINSISDMNFSNPKLELSKNEFLSIAEEIKKEVNL
ncbi:MAG: HIT family protein [Flammeovirgaceae bacterium]|nr:HIT family protein [Flammeovirgaceae bacterium]|tara:strand:- start:12944 stop:13342 length:399 start_codon:yes stop_codon:yes gene_type:complete